MLISSQNALSSFSSRVLHLPSFLYRLFPLQLRSHPPPPPTPQTLPLLSPPPLGRSCGTLWRRSVHRTHVFTRMSHPRTRRYSPHALRPRHVFPGPLSVARRKVDAYRSTFLVRVFALFLSPIVYLHSSGAHAEQGPREVPLNYRTNGREQLPSSLVSCGRVSKARRADRDASTCGRWRWFSHGLCD